MPSISGSPAKTRVSYRRSCRPAFASRVRLCHKQEENKARENNCGSKLSLLGQCLKKDLKAGRTGSARLGLTLAFSCPSPWADTMVTGTAMGEAARKWPGRATPITDTGPHLPSFHDLPSTARSGFLSSRRLCCSFRQSPFELVGSRNHLTGTD